MLIQQRQIFLHTCHLGGEELGELRNQGVSDELYQDLLQEKQIQLTQLFARYAKTSTSILINQRFIVSAKAILLIFHQSNISVYAKHF